MKSNIKSNITRLSELIKKKINGKKSIQSLIFLSLTWLYSKEETRKVKRLKILSYAVVKKKLSQFGVKLLYDFALDEFKKDFATWLSQSDSQKSKKRISLRIDTTKSGKKYGKQIEGLEWLYDYVNNCYIKTHEIFLLLVSIGKKNYIIEFILMKKSRREGWDSLAEKSIERFVNKLGKEKQFLKQYCRLSLDGAFGNGKMLKYLSTAGFQYTALKSGGKDRVLYNGNTLSLKELERELAFKGELKSFNEKHNLRGMYYSANVTLVNGNIPVRAILRRFKRSKGFSYQLLLSVNLNIYDYQIVQCYRLRWGIEECIKECKDAVHVMDYSYHTTGTMRNVECFLALRFIGYMIVNWYRIEHCRPSKTSFWGAANKIRSQFRKMSYRALWNLFSP